MTASTATPPSPPLVLVFAASDPSSGAGIQADLLTLASLGCHPLTALTAVTVQDTVGVQSVHPLSAELVEQQARTILEDMPVVAFKIGVLGSVENVLAVAEIVSDYPEIPLILDPVLASGRGDDLSGEEIISAIREMLLPQTTLLTPNAPEARRLAESDEDDSEPSIDICAQRLIEMGAQYVLITGTHENTAQVINTLYGPDGAIRRDEWERLPGSYHGSGCTLASAIAGCIAGGASVEDAVRDAQDYTWQTLKNGFRAGMGQFIPDRFFWARSTDDAVEESTPETQPDAHE
ncbi:bifunctional hydroxymethylpyrimidine kinase/phosphomethylpyrimidine kinase [Ferribacterium limneticum]|uniref:bifunctional hydroxymethylpyrimidine kinase/phosphomethylpyrimidine kinase n=1 Tax=Ferribacterium limneticum TaxID=76259 RepID=UPI001CFA6444|nr:hydroxymethylpyrimidine/phosphomethylpyrimidine kinase [Ferribacterium limneticum]UCV28221.1 hydroxymethylpyrimidine/phosphomethylpyrimidine kinase [Ferribacterium limneticum]UCV32138.1 hydroxymethylpyrimidine/phosphomethylpyrimidine kinase [Ferribacterium limneticum]